MSINTLEHTLSGQEAIQALNLYIEELENQKAPDSDKGYASVRIEIAKALCRAILNSEIDKAEDKQIVTT